MHMCTLSTDMCSVHRRDMQCYLVLVRDEQKIIADWMRRQLDRLGWTAKHWAEQAGVNPSTVTRAMEPDYASVTSLPTIDKLAQAAGATSPLEYLERNGSASHRKATPSEGALRIMLGTLLREDPASDRVYSLARGLGHGLAVLARNPEIAENEDKLIGVAESLSALLPPPDTWQ